MGRLPVHDAHETKRGLNMMSLLAAALALTATSPTKATGPAWGSGVEMDDRTTLPLVIFSLPDDAQKIGLTEERVRAHIELKIRQSGIKPVPPPESSGLEVKIDVIAIERVGDSAPLGAAYCVYVGFQRPVSYTIGKATRKALGTTWDRSKSGLINHRDPAAILNVVDDLLEVFLNEYMKGDAARMQDQP
jgi:hypothetical protein